MNERKNEQRGDDVSFSDQRISSQPTRNHLCANPNLWDVGTKYKAKWSVQHGERAKR